VLNAQPDSQPLSAQTGWTLTWHDEFDGSTLDPAKWAYDTGGHGWGNNELEYYTARPENVAVENGMLVIRALKETYTEEGITRQYTSGRRLTKGKFSQACGSMIASITR
jgi:beta-glucanase (GH16 family)